MTPSLALCLSVLLPFSSSRSSKIEPKHPINLNGRMRHGIFSAGEHVPPYWTQQSQIYVVVQSAFPQGSLLALVQPWDVPKIVRGSIEPEKRMTESCFKKKISDPPVCGVHNVAIVQRIISIDSNAPELGHITCDMCPVSRSVVREVMGFKRRSSILRTTQLH